MAQEVCNRISKDCKGYGANNTPKAMMRASKAAAGVHLIVKQVNDVSSIKPISQVHAHEESSGEVIVMFKGLRQLRPFDSKKGRFHRNFQEIVVLPTSSVNMSSLFSWLEKHKNTKIERTTILEPNWKFFCKQYCNTLLKYLFASCLEKFAIIIVNKLAFHFGHRQDRV